MPIYEEKLISPFAIRYTQEHIRTTFRDGRIVEDTVLEIETQPGTGEYDLVLKAPFPHIEIIRWHPPSLGSDGDHWFTLDNRRLYCLQRAAVKHWPKTVAVVVEILYDASHSAWRKYDSSTQGRSVSISHSCKSAELCRWDWSQVVPQVLGDARSQELIFADCKKQVVHELLDTFQESSSLMALARKLGPKVIEQGSASLKTCGSSNAGVPTACSTPSAISEHSDSESLSNGSSASGSIAAAEAELQVCRVPQPSSRSNCRTKAWTSNRDKQDHYAPKAKAPQRSWKWDAWNYSYGSSTWDHSYEGPSSRHGPAHKKSSASNTAHAKYSQAYKSRLRR